MTATTTAVMPENGNVPARARNRRTAAPQNDKERKEGQVGTLRAAR